MGYRIGPGAGHPSVDGIGQRRIGPSLKDWVSLARDWNTAMLYCRVATPNPL